LSGEYGVSVTFNVSDLTLFDIGDDLRLNSFKERGDNEDQPNIMSKHVIDPLKVPNEPITRARIKKFKEALNGLIQHIRDKIDLGEQVAPMELKEQPSIHLIQVQERPNPCTT
jgi:hypothetical protein